MEKFFIYLFKKKSFTSNSYKKLLSTHFFLSRCLGGRSWKIPPSGASQVEVLVVVASEGRPVVRRAALLDGALGEVPASTAEPSRSARHPRPWLSNKALMSRGDLETAPPVLIPSLYFLNLKTFISH